MGNATLSQPLTYVGQPQKEDGRYKHHDDADNV